jgi:hypothetical protein
MHPRLGRRQEFDERSRAFPVRALISATTPRSYTWRCTKWLDQGSEPACVGFSLSHELIARPKEHLEIGETDALAFYHRAQQLDQWPGEDYDGTSVLAGLKAAKERGLITEYRWAFGLDDLILAVGYKGPAVIGIDWFEDMFDPDPQGYVTPTGDVAGGHAILVNGVSVTKKHFRLRNSWGRSWGYPYGNCFIRWADMGKLLAAGGEAAIPIVRT